jgi:hypothetical protein
MNPYDPIDFISTIDIFPNTNQELFNLSFENEEDIKNSFGPTQLNNSFNEYNYSNKYEIPNYNPIEQNKPKPKKPSNNPEDKITLLGRKTKDSGETGEHTKYSEDNMARKIKVLLKNDLLEFTNDKIKIELNLSEIKINDKIYKNDQIKLLNIKQTKTLDITVDGIKTFLNTKVKDFFNDEVSKNYSSYPPNFNGLLIEKLYEMENAESVTSILDKTMLECLKYYRKDEDVIDNYEYVCLKGLEKKFEGLKDRLMKNPEKKNDEKYVDELINLIMEFEDVFSKKRPRMKRSKNH